LASGPVLTTIYRVHTFHNFFRPVVLAAGLIVSTASTAGWCSQMKLRLTHVLMPLLILATTFSWAAEKIATSDEGGCWQVARQLPHNAASFEHGLAAAPREAVRWNNLKWELPVATAAAVLIAAGDDHINRHIQSTSFVQASTRTSNIGLGVELGTAGLMYLAGCAKHRSPYLANTGFTALEAMGAANVMTFAVKVATNRQYAYHANPHGEFWEGGRSFPSGHAATSFAFASVIAHRYPHNFWLKWGAYGLATGVSLARVGGKKHFVSDILIGGTLGYVTGSFMATH
jgi:membrane-associated phospholipid phosphatase